jgi:predicted metal-binding protein
VALSGPGRWGYVYGGLDPAQHLAAVREGAARYAAAADGLVPWRDRPEVFRKQSVARIPPQEPAP